MKLTEEQLAYWEGVKAAGVTHVPVALGTSNLGDDIQSLAALRYLGVKETVHRDGAESWPEGAVVILSGWWGAKANVLPMSSDQCRVIVAGMHLWTDPGRLVVYDELELWDRLKAAVEQQGFPAGARDLETLRLLEAHGVPAVFSGCVSQTLARTLPGHLRRLKLAIEAPLPNSSWVPVTHRRKELARMDAAGRLSMAEAAVLQLELAEKVVTSKLHAYLPAEALGCPVVKFGGEITHDPGRWEGHREEDETSESKYETSKGD